MSWGFFADNHIVHIIEAIVFLAAIGATSRFCSRRGGKSSSRALVAKEVVVNENGPRYVHLVGRRPGFFAWLLSQIGIDPVTTLDVYDDRIEFEEGAWSGRVTHMLPLCSICDFGAGYTKPLSYLVVASLMVAVAFASLFFNVTAMVFFFLLFSAIVVVVAYFLNKTLSLFFLPASSLGASMGLLRSVIDGVSIDERKANEIIDLVSVLIDRRASAKRISDGSSS